MQWKCHSIADCAWSRKRPVTSQQSSIGVCGHERLTLGSVSKNKFSSPLADLCQPAGVVWSRVKRPMVCGCIHGKQYPATSAYKQWVQAKINDTSVLELIQRTRQIRNKVYWTDTPVNQASQNSHRGACICFYSAAQHTSCYHYMNRSCFHATLTSLHE